MIKVLIARTARGHLAHASDPLGSADGLSIPCEHPGDAAKMAVDDLIRNAQRAVEDQIARDNAARQAELTLVPATPQSLAQACADTQRLYSH